RTASKEIFKIMATITPLIQPVSIDEGYMDITETPGNPMAIAKRLQRDIQDKLDLPSSIGIAPNKFLAKMASDMKKPLDITMLWQRDLRLTLWSLPVDKMYGVGSKTADKLRAINIKSTGYLAKADAYQLKHVLAI